MEKPRFRLFSARDGKTFVEHLGDAWAWIKGLPAKVRALLPAAEDMVEAVEVLAEAIKEGSPIDQAVDKALAYLPKAHAFYEWAQKWLPIVAERLRELHIEIGEGVQYFDGSSPERSLQAAKRDAAAEMVIMYHGGESEVERVLANSAVETAVIIVKHSDLL